MPIDITFINSLLHQGDSFAEHTLNEIKICHAASQWATTNSQLERASS